MKTLKPGMIVTVKDRNQFMDGAYVVTHETMGGKKVYVKPINSKFNIDPFYRQYILIEVEKCSLKT